LGRRVGGGPEATNAGRGQGSVVEEEAQHIASIGAPATLPV
jgi:hypothetical protein